ncbi:MAG: PUR family DNA/RNA-binding protein [Weeksellaceae bacterium]|nr:PUR family DNA/RNA-binding protein [Weeksellaceae bacterium]
MNDNNMNDQSNDDEIFSNSLRAGRRTYFFDVRETRAGDYYLTITESKKSMNEDGSYYFKKHKIYLYKEDFDGFLDCLHDATDFVKEEKGDEVISERHQKSYDPDKRDEVDAGHSSDDTDISSFTDLSFEDI